MGFNLFPNEEVIRNIKKKALLLSFLFQKKKFQ